MNAVLALFTLVTGLGEPRTVTGPVSKVSFDALGQASGLRVGLNVGKDDPRWRDRELALYGAKLYVEGKLVTLPEAIQWLSTAVKVDEKHENVLGVIEVTATVDPNRYVQIVRADFKLVPWERYYPRTAK